MKLLYYDGVAILDVPTTPFLRGTMVPMDWYVVKLVLSIIGGFFLFVAFFLWVSPVPRSPAMPELPPHEGNLDIDSQAAIPGFTIDIVDGLVVKVPEGVIAIRHSEAIPFDFGLIKTESAAAGASVPVLYATRLGTTSLSSEVLEYELATTTYEVLSTSQEYVAVRYTPPTTSEHKPMPIVRLQYFAEANTLLRFDVDEEYYQEQFDTFLSAIVQRNSEQPSGR